MGDLGFRSQDSEFASSPWPRVVETPVAPANRPQKDRIDASCQHGTFVDEVVGRPGRGLLGWIRRPVPRLVLPLVLLLLLLPEQLGVIVLVGSSLSFHSASTTTTTTTQGSSKNAVLLGERGSLHSAGGVCWRWSWWQRERRRPADPNPPTWQLLQSGWPRTVRSGIARPADKPPTVGHVFVPAACIRCLVRPS
jgi:hypothetical protein